MKSFKPSLSITLTAALLALVPLLAVLQYRWVGQVSQAERDRMRSSLESAVKNFTDEFDRELGRAYVDLQLDLPSHPGEQSPAKDWREQAIRNYGDRYARWLAQAEHPELVRDIYLLQAGSGITQFDKSASAFKPAEWPSELVPYKSRFEHDLAVNPNERSPFRVRQIQTTIDDIPAMVIPIPDVKFFGDQTKLSVVTPGLSVPGFIIAILDKQYIYDRLLPKLAARYFASGGGQFDYNVAVMRVSDSKEVIYQSDRNSPPPGTAKPDATANMFRLRLEMPGLMESFTREVAAQQGAQKKAAIFNNEIAVQYINREAHTIIGNDSAKDKPVNARIAVVGADSGRWQLVATHRAGSLDAAVASVRRRNLLISFTILLLLSFSVGLIVITTRRAGRLARQQMEFVAGVSHELRTPLSVIRSAAENLADGVIEDRDRIRKYGKLIEQEGRRLSAMVEQTLEFAGIQSGKRTYTLQPTSVADVVQDAIAASKALLEESQIQLETTIKAGLPEVNADRAALTRAIQNLINNAVKYSGDQRVIRLVARDDRTSNPPSVIVDVEDSGIGIGASELRHIFEPFYRGREVVASQIHGNGLGLSLVRHIVRSHGGDVSVESRTGHGSRFSIRIPALAETSREIEIASQPTHVPRRADS